MLFRVSLICLLILQISSVRITTTDSKRDDENHFMVITGKGSVYFPTNLIKIGFTIETKDLEFGDSFGRNYNISRRVDDLLRNEFYIPEKNISTISYEMYPNYYTVEDRYNYTKTSIFDGYVVKNQLEVKTFDRKFVADLIDKLISVGVNKINYINFEVEPELIEAMRKNLTISAVNDAFEKANLLAKNSKVKIVDVNSISIGDKIIPFKKSIDMSTVSMQWQTMAGKIPRIYSDEKEVRVMVTIEFIIKKN